MISAEVRGSEAVIARIKRFTPRIRELMELDMQRLLITMQASVKATKLSGSPLNRRTGTLSRSINYDVEVKEKSVVGRLYAGKEAPYAAIHEYGGTFNIPFHMRWVHTVFGEEVEPFQVPVTAHTATFRERAFMRPTLKSSQEDFRRMVADVVRKAAMT